MHEAHPLVESRPYAWLSTIQDVLWLLLVALVPLFVNLWGTQPFELPKAAIARTLVWLLAAFSLAEGILSPTHSRPPALPPLALIATILLALAIAIATQTAMDRGLSLWGSYERAQGAATLISYLMLMLMASQRFRRVGPAQGIMRSIILTTVPLVALSLAETLGSRPFDLVSDARSPIIATLGRANFVGAYLALVAPLTLAAAVQTSLRARRLGRLALLGMQLLIIGVSRSRAAWAATVVGLAVFTLLHRGRSLAPISRIGAWIGTCLIGLAGPAAVLWLGARRTGSIAARLTIWQAVLRLIRRRPWLGYGPDALGQAFHGVYPPQLVYQQGRDVFVDRAHNLLLDWAVTTGLVGLLALALLLVTFVLVSVRAVRHPRSPRQHAWSAASVAAVAANLVNTSVSFDVTATATMMWLLMGVGFALAARESRPERRPSLLSPLWRRALAVGLIAATLHAGYAVNVKPVQADIAARTAWQAVQQGSMATAIAAQQRATELWPAEPRHHLSLADYAWRQSLTTHTAAIDALGLAEAALLEARSRRPLDPGVWLHSASFYAAAARRFGADTHDLANDAFGQAAVLAPHEAAIYAAWGEAELAAGAAQSAAELLARATELDATYGWAYLLLGDASLALDRDAEAEAAYREATKWLSDPGDAYAGLAECHRRAGRELEAQEALRAALRYDPDNSRAFDMLQSVGGTP